MSRFALLFSIMLINMMCLIAQKPGDKVKSIFVDDYNHLWFGTDSGLLIKCGDIWKAYYPKGGLPFKVNDIKRKKTKDTDLWIATSAGIIKAGYSSNGLCSVTVFDSSKTTFLTDNIIAIDFDAYDAGYFATPKGIGVLVNEVWKFYTRLIDVVRNEFTAVSVKDDTIYFGTKGEGVARIVKRADAYTGASSYITPWSALTGDSINCMFIDSKGNQWYGTNKGLSRHSNTEAKEGWDLFLTDKVPFLHVSAINEDRMGNFWIGTTDGLVELNHDLCKVRTWTIRDGLPSNIIYSICIDNDRSIWIGTSLGVSHFTKSVFSNIRTSEYTRDFIYF